MTSAHVRTSADQRWTGRPASPESWRRSARPACCTHKDGRHWVLAIVVTKLLVVTSRTCIVRRQSRAKITGTHVGERVDIWELLEETDRWRSWRRWPHDMAFPRCGEFPARVRQWPSAACEVLRRWWFSPSASPHRRWRRQWQYLAWTNLWHRWFLRYAARACT